MFSVSEDSPVSSLGKFIFPSAGVVSGDCAFDSPSVVPEAPSSVGEKGGNCEKRVD